MNSGLTSEEVKSRIDKGLINYDTTIKTDTIVKIFLKHIFTLFNLLNFILFLIIIYLHSYKNGLFMMVVVLNTIIGIYQEIKSKIIIDKLSLLVNNEVIGIRDNKEVKLSINEIVMDDILKFKVGNSVVVDSVVVSGEVLVNESFITGESESILKKIGDELTSGSFIINGTCLAQVIHIGDANYTAIITKEARKIKKMKSEIMLSINKIIRYISYVLVPLGIIFLIHQMNITGNTLNDALIKMVAAMIGMIPDGLVLLTSTVLMVSVIRLAKNKVLVHDLYSIDSLARVDTICFDKTGTLTTGNIVLDKVIILDKNIDIENIMNSIISNLSDLNSTMEALKVKYNSSSNLKIKKIEEFSSETKYTKVIFENNDTYFLGAYEYIKTSSEYDELVNSYVINYRTLALTHNKKLVAIFLMKDEIRKSIKKVMNYLKKNHVDIKILSGDNPKTVHTIALELGLKNMDNIQDMTNIVEDNIDNKLISNNIFGRVTPSGKKAIINKLQENGHYVAMVGDGVNDVLALKQADSSISLNSGTEAAINVSDIVLVDSDFKKITSAILEGRRTVNNIERSASLFLTKTMYNIMLTILFIFINMTYPIIPIQFSLISAFTIGIPGFILSFENNYNIIKKGFLMNILKVVLPFSISIVISIIITMITGNLFKISDSSLSTISVLLILSVAFYLLYRVCTPFNKYRKWLYISLIILCLIVLILFRNFYNLTILNIKEYVILIILVINAFILVKISDTIIKRVGVA